MVPKRGKRRSSKSKSHELRIPAFEALNAEELTRQSRSIEVKNAFYISGMALVQLKEERLYRKTHLSFDEFCQDIFGYSSDYTYLKIAAAKVISKFTRWRGFISRNTDQWSATNITDSPTCHLNHKLSDKALAVIVNLCPCCLCCCLNS